METSVAREMPRYVCHKRVWALKIAEVRGTTLVPEDGELYAPIEVGGEWIARHKPQAGGYYVTYEDGYTSYSPAEAFESGYSRER